MALCQRPLSWDDSPIAMCFNKNEFTRAQRGAKYSADYSDEKHVGAYAVVKYINSVELLSMQETRRRRHTVLTAGLNNDIREPQD